MPKIAIFDYGAGNLFNLQQSLLRNGAQADIVDTFRKIEDYDGIVLPGVGNFDNASAPVVATELVCPSISSQGPDLSWVGNAILSQRGRDLGRAEDTRWRRGDVTKDHC